MLPAIERYTGGVYKSIKKARREGYWPAETDILIISAKYGLISGDTPIEMYDQKMTRDRAVELQKEVSSSLDVLLQERNYNQIFLNLGSIYLQSITLSSEIDRARQSGRLQEVAGEIGMRLRQTKYWLEEQHKEDRKISIG
nr:DUF6884 domain-containing protein [Ktedonobacter racemifer]